LADLLSIIVATYNWPEALDAVLHGLSRQSDRGFEIVVADDGSGPQTRNIVEDWRANIGVDLRHVWHEDRGFRLAEIRNRAVAASRGEICVFLDGDSIPLAGFVAAHRRLAAPGWFVAGNRVLLSPALTARVLRDRTMLESWSLAQWIAARRAGHINRIAPLLTLPLGPLRRLNARSWKGARGGNLAIRRSDLDRIDGFDAAFSGWGLEDSDIIVRLIRSGVRRKDGRFATGVLHLWHPEKDRSRLPENAAKLEDVIRSDRVRSVHGLSVMKADAGARLAG
jgi:glycosyltransferase involved in cell wall biosynthesis